MIAFTRPHAPDAEREPFTKLRPNETCEACGRQGWCMVSPVTIWCMRNPDGAYHERRDKAGHPVYLHRRTGAAPPPRPPRRDEPADWTRPAPVTCGALYQDLLANMTRPAPPEAQAADARRFGAHALAVAAVEDAVYFRPPAEVLAWLRAHGRMPDALAAGVVYRDETGEDWLAGALVAAKVHVYRERGQVKNLKGRKLDPAAKVKALSLYGTREERGCPHVLYQHDQLARATDGLLVLAGGPAKVDACLAAGFHAAGGEETLSDAQIAAIAAARPAGIVVFADGEDAQAPGDLSPGQRHALAMAERLEELGGQAVRIAEPEREPGSPKIDADSLLRDHGPEALRAVVRAALPLALYRQASGAAGEAATSAPAAALEHQLAHCRAESARKDARIAALEREVTALEAAIKHPDQAASIGALDFVDAARRAYDAGEVLTVDGRDFARIPYIKAAKRRGAKTLSRGLKSLIGTDPHAALPREPVAFGDGQAFAAFARPERIETPAVKREVDIAYLHIPESLRNQRGQAVLGILPTCAVEKKHGGRRTIPVPPEVAAQENPVRRKREHVSRWFDALTDRPLTTQTEHLGTDYWTAQGEQLLPDEVERRRVAAGYEPPRVPTWRPTQPALRVHHDPRQDADKEPLNTSRQDADPPAADRDGNPEACSSPGCPARKVIGGYCAVHFAAHRDEHQRRYASDWGDAFQDEMGRTPPPPASVRLCLSASRGCRNRVDPGEDYCAACARRGYVNAPAPAYAAGA